jgi:hypothetical protein
MTGISKNRSQWVFQNTLQIQIQDKTLIPNFNRVEFGTYGIVSYDLSDSFSIDTDCDMTHSRVCSVLLKSSDVRERAQLNSVDFIVRRRQSMVGA